MRRGIVPEDARVVEARDLAVGAAAFARETCHVDASAEPVDEGAVEARQGRDLVDEAFEGGGIALLNARHQ